MDFNQAMNLIRSKFNTDITVAEGIATQFPNQEFTPPDETTWMRFTIVAANATKITINGATNNQYRVVGTMIIQIFTVAGEGDGPANQLATTVQDNFTTVTADGIKYFVPSIIPVGVVGDFMQTNVVCPFRFDYIK